MGYTAVGIGGRHMFMGLMYVLAGFLGIICTAVFLQRRWDALSADLGDLRRKMFPRRKDEN
jgi:hypothetical protein